MVVWSLSCGTVAAQPSEAVEPSSGTSAARRATEVDAVEKSPAVEPDSGQGSAEPSASAAVATTQPESAESEPEPTAVAVGSDGAVASGSEPATTSDSSASGVVAGSQDLDPCQPEPAGSQASSGSGDTPPGYRALLRRGVCEYSRYNYAEARAAFKAAHDLYPNARTLRGLGKSEYELRNYGAAIEYLEKALVSQVLPLPPELRQSTQYVLEAAKGYVARLELEVSPANAHIMIDGQRIDLGGGGRLVVTVGDHVLDVRAPGYINERRRLKVTGGEQVDLQVQLLKLASEQSLTLTTEEVEESPPFYERWWFWTFAGAVAAGAVVGAVALSGGGETMGPAVETSGGIRSQVVALKVGQ